MSVGVERSATGGDGRDRPTGVVVDGTGEVVLIPWPAAADERRSLAVRGVARLLLVEGDAPAPVCDDPLEDWIRVPTSDADIDTRVTVLARRAVLRPGANRPVIDADGVVRLGRNWSALPPVEARLMVALVERFGTVVHRDVLASAGWPDGLPGRNALDVHVLRLRRRIAPVGLIIRTVRARGYLLEVASDSSEP